MDKSRDLSGGHGGGEVKQMARRCIGSG